MRLLLLSLLAVSLLAAEKKVIVAGGGPPPAGPYTPGLLVDDYLYVSGQGAAKGDGTLPETTEEQFTQSLANVRRIVEAAGLTMEHVVYSHVYLKDMAALGTLNRVWDGAFPRNPPARAVVGVANLPGGNPIQITVVAYRDLSKKQTVGAPGRTTLGGEPQGVLTGDRLYLSGFPTLEAMGGVLKAAGLDFKNLVFVNPYLTDKMPAGAMNAEYAKYFEFGNTPARATIHVASLPGSAAAMFTGVAVRDLSKRQAVRPKNMAPSPTASPCVWAGDTYYCSAKSGFIPGPSSGIYASTVETQLRQTMRNLLDGLEEAGLTFANVVSSTVYLDDMADFAKMNKVYAEYFSAVPPTRSTVQQRPAGERKPDARDRWPTLEQISIIAVK